MAKIIKRGNANHNKPWIGYEATCSECHCEFEMDSNDRPKFVSDQREGDFYMVKCPDCKNTFAVSADLLKNRR